MKHVQLLEYRTRGVRDQWLFLVADDFVDQSIQRSFGTATINLLREPTCHSIAFVALARVQTTIRTGVADEAERSNAVPFAQRLSRNQRDEKKTNQSEGKDR